MEYAKMNYKLKTYYILLSILFFCSCKNKDNINDTEYRNAEYVFYKKDGQKGYWQKVSENSTFQYNKAIINGFYNNGNKFAEIEILDSFPNRIEKFFDKETSELMKTVWIKNNSEYKRIYENGYHKHFYSAKGKIIIEEGLVKNSMEQGLWKRYRNENGKLEEIINFKDGKPHGERKNYWENGKLKSSAYWVFGIQCGKGFFYYENGNMEESNYRCNEKLHGSYKSYYPNKTLKTDCNYWNDKSIDTCKRFYPNGILKKLEINKLDTITLTSYGTTFFYYENGLLQMEVEGKDYSPNGKVKIYYENGILNKEFNLIGKIKKGEFKEYYKNGKLSFVANFKNNVHHGIAKYYNKEGKLIETARFENGTKINSTLKKN